VHARWVASGSAQAAGCGPFAGCAARHWHALEGLVCCMALASALAYSPSDWAISSRSEAGPAGGQNVCPHAFLLFLALCIPGRDFEKDTIYLVLSENAGGARKHHDPE